MPFNPEDPKWTAYVLDELELAVRDAVEQELADSPEARQLVSELRETTCLLETNLKFEPMTELSASQRAKIDRQVTRPGIPESRTMRRVITWSVVGAIAASLLVMVGIASVNSMYLAKRMSARHGDIEFTAGKSIAEQPTQGSESKDIAYTVGKPMYETKPKYGAPVYEKVESAAETSSLMMSVTPKIIVQEEDDELLSRRGFISPESNSPSNRHFSSVELDLYSDGNSVADELVTYPDSTKWEELTQRRKKYERVNVLPLFSQIGEVTTFNLEKHGHLYEQGSAESYDSVTDNPFWPARENPLSTFSIDVDTASYSNIRRFLTQNNSLPPKGAVRIEEMINYFRYDYPQPEGDVPFSVTTEVAGCPWNADHRLVRIGLKGREIAPKKRPPSNLVFLIDVSGSMTDANKLPMVRESMKLLTEQLTENDRVAIVVYAGNSGLVLPSTTGDKQREIREAIDRLEAGGSTNGGEGIQLAYDMAAGNFIKGGTNRVILATDGDFNVGITNRDDLIKLITEKAKSGVFLTTLGFGMGNLKDATLEQLADKGNGNYAYIDDMREAKKVFVEQMNGTLITIAKDVKIQIEFNPAEVASYRLIGYENRILAHHDFNDDKKDAGEIGSGHTVTALYEIAPAAGAGVEGERPAVDPLKYQKPNQPVNEEKEKGELLTLKLRYKQPDGDTSKLIETPVVDGRQPYGKATSDFKFAASVALFGMILRESPHKGTGSLDAAVELAGEGLGKDEGGYRAEFLQLIKQAKEFAKR